MTSDLGIPLTPRPLLMRAALALAVVGVPLTWYVWASADAYRAAIAAGVLALLVLLPLWTVWLLRGRRFLVHADRLSVMRGDRVVRELAFAELTEVRPQWEGSAGAATPEFLNKSVTLLGRTPAGRRTGVKVSAQTVDSIDPLLRALAPEIRRRPGLLTRDLYRNAFVEFIDDAESGDAPQRE